MQHAKIAIASQLAERRMPKTSRLLPFIVLIKVWGKRVTFTSVFVCSLLRALAGATDWPGWRSSCNLRLAVVIQRVWRASPMSPPPLSAEQLEELRRFNSPTISNAIEVFNVRPRNVGFLPHQIRCMFPDMPPIVGYAVTAQTRAAYTPTPGPDLLSDYLRYVAAQPGPKIAVGQDLDDPPGLGAQFGEVTATIHRKLGCVGHVTSGCPRDLDEVRALDFQLFGLNPCVSHAYVRLEDFGKPVWLAGVEVRPGDLLHADKHGVC